MVTSNSLISDTNPAANQRPAVVPSSSTREHAPSHLASSSQSLPAALMTSQITSGSPSATSATTTHVLPSYRQASYSGGASTSSTSASSHAHSPGNPSQAQAHSQRQLNTSSLPDILQHSHPGPSLRQNQHRHNRDRQQRPRSHHVHGGDAGALSTRPGGQQPHGGRHRPRGERGTRRNRTLSTSSTQTQGQDGGSCKGPCVKCVVTFTSFRWVLVALSILGVCCVVSGIILAALHAVGNSFLFLAIMFIGLGVLLVVVVALGWKCTPRGHEPLHALFRIGNFQNRRPRERRHRRHRNRDGTWFGGVLYPEFQYRRPPPSYAASMQDYNNQSLQELRTSGALSAGNIDSGSLPSSPPPSYRSRTSTMHSGITSTFPGGQSSELPNSRPPTYRSRAPSRRPSLPREEGRESDQTAPADVDFTESMASEGNTATDAQAGNQIFTVSTSNTAGASPSSSSQSPPSLQVPSQSHVVNIDSDQPLALASAQPMQTSSHTNDTVPVSDPTDIQISQTVSHSTSDALPSSSTSAPVPSLHQRMKSEDREMLERALQSLDTQISTEEDGGHVNHGASFHDADNFDTHL